ncbi:MAG: amidohydrolase family protein, partial [Acidobacteriaceae bacterium]|nr:amidohydrolase family protein [Acidobacteriaceae bacterium]
MTPRSDAASLAVINCGQLVTLTGPARARRREELKELSIIRNGGMLVRNGRIEAMAGTHEIEQQLTPEYQVIDACNQVVLPGFVDAHTHAVFGGTRVEEYELRTAGASYQQIAGAGGGIRSTVRKTRAITEDELLEASRRYWNWFLRSGTTTVEAKSGYGLSLEDELKMLRVIRRFGYVPTFLGAHEIPDEYRGNRDGYIDLVIDQMLPRAAELAEYCDIFCEPKVFDVPSSRRILAHARALGFKLRIH